MVHVRYPDGTTAFFCIGHVGAAGEVDDWHEVGGVCGAPDAIWLVSHGPLEEGSCRT